jgi:hypothetical protein
MTLSIMIFSQLSEDNSYNELFEDFLKLSKNSEIFNKKLKRLSKKKSLYNSILNHILSLTLST